MSNIDKIANWDEYEAGQEEAKDILKHSSDVLFGVRLAIDEYAEDELLSKPGNLSYKSGYLDVIIQALKDESERVKNEVMTIYVEGENYEREECDGYTDPRRDSEE